MPRSLRERLAWLAITVFLGFEIRHDFLRLLDPTYKAAFQQDSDSLVRDEMLDPAPVLFPLLGGQERDYTSQFGLQGMVMTWLSPGDHFYEAMRLTTAMLTAAVLALAVVACWRVWGGRAAGVLLALLTMSFWTNGFGASTYWQLWTLLLPTLVPLLVWPRLGTGRRKWLRGGALIAALVFLKSLCGYEFITTVLLGAAAAVAFHEFRERLDRHLLAHLGAAIGAGVVGFAAAIGVHMGQLAMLYGDVSIIEQRMAERTFSPSTTAQISTAAREQNDPLWGWLVQGDNLLGLWAFKMADYLTTPAIALPAPQSSGFGNAAYGIPIWAFIVVFALLAVQASRGRQVDAAVQRRLAVAAGIGLLGGLSWLVLAYGHMINHAHIDAIVFYLPFLPLVFAMIAIRVQAVSLRAWPRRAEGHGLSGDVDEAARAPAPRSSELVAVGDGAR